MKFYRDTDQDGYLTAYSDDGSLCLSDISKDYNGGMPSEISYYRYNSANERYVLQAYKRFNPGALNFPKCFADVFEIEIELLFRDGNQIENIKKTELETLFELFKCLLNAPGEISEGGRRDFTLKYENDESISPLNLTTVPRQHSRDRMMSLHKR